MDDKDLFTTDYQKCRKNAENQIYANFLNHVKWENLEHDLLKKVFYIVSSKIVPKERFEMVSKRNGLWSKNEIRF